MNIQDECIKIHSKFGMSEMANYKIQLLFDSEIEKVRKEYEEKLRWIPVEEFDFKIKESNEPDIIICKEDNIYSVIEITDLYSVNYVKNNFSHCRSFL